MAFSGWKLVIVGVIAFDLNSKQENLDVKIVDNDEWCQILAWAKKKTANTLSSKKHVSKSVRNGVKVRLTKTKKDQLQNVRRQIGHTKVDTI